MPLPQLQASGLTRPTIPKTGGSGPFIPTPERREPQRKPTPIGGPLVPPTKPAPQQQGFRQGAGYQNWQSGNNAQRQQFLQRQQRMQQAGGIGAVQRARAPQQPPIQTSMPQVQASALGGGFAAMPGTPPGAGPWMGNRIWT